MESHAIPTRKTERIDCSICSLCYAAIPDNKLAAHMEWHMAQTVDVSDVRYDDDTRPHR